MDNIKTNKYYIDKLINHLQIIINNTKDCQMQDMDVDSLLCDSVLFRIIQISEIIDNLSEDFKNQYPSIPWKAIKGMRNKIVHEYGNVRIDIIYDTVKEDIPKLLKQLVDSFR